MRAKINKDHCIFEKDGAFFKVGFMSYFYCVALYDVDNEIVFGLSKEAVKDAIELLLTKMNEMLNNYAEFLNNFVVFANGKVSITFKNGRLRFIITDVVLDYLYVSVSIPGLVDFGNFIVRNVFDVDKLRLFIRAEQI